MVTEIKLKLKLFFRLISAIVQRQVEKKCAIHTPERVGSDFLICI